MRVGRLNFVYDNGLENSPYHIISEMGLKVKMQDSGRTKRRGSVKRNFYSTFRSKERKKWVHLVIYSSFILDNSQFNNVAQSHSHFEQHGQHLPIFSLSSLQNAVPLFQVLFNSISTFSLQIQTFQLQFLYKISILL